MSLEVLLAGGGELHGNQLEATVLEAGDDGTNESTLGTDVSEYSSIGDQTGHCCCIQFVDHCVHTWTPSGLMAMKLQQLR